MRGFGKGRYRARPAKTQGDVRSAQRLRHLAFHKVDGIDADRFDDLCTHVLIEDVQTDQLVACFRYMFLPSGRQIAQSYAAQFYELAPLVSFEGALIEMGRFCLRPGLHDPDILRVAWGAMTRLVDEKEVKLLFGCSSFAGTEGRAHGDAFAWIRDRHLAPRHLAPGVKAPNVFRFSTRLRRKADPRRAMQAMPPLLRTYLGMGGWVSDHAVIDAELNTLHVFTAVEIQAVPAARARALRAVAS